MSKYNIIALVLIVLIAAYGIFIGTKQNKENKIEDNLSKITTPSPTLTPTINPSNEVITEAITPLPTTPAASVPAEIVWGNRNKKQIIFTFDAGSGTQSARKILDILKKNNLKGTFFLTGKWAEQNQTLTKEIANEGHEIFNHTYTHPHLTKTSDENIISELKKTNDLILSLTGKTTKPHFRPPFGERNMHVLEIAGKEGYQSVYWTIDALDWKEDQGVTENQVRDKILTNLNPGTIFLMHIGDNITGNILDEMISEIQNKGYRIVSLTEGIK